MKNNNLFVIIIGITFVLGLSACNISLAQDVTPPPGFQSPVTRETIESVSVFPLAKPNPFDGRDIYLEKCEPCHGETGLGDGSQSLNLPVKVSAIGTLEFANQSSPSTWFNTIKNGDLDSFMPPFSGSLSDQDIWDVLAYVYDLGASSEVLAEGEQAFQSICADCHGDEGMGDGAPGAADLTDPEKMTTLSGDDIILKMLTGNENENHVFADKLDAEEQMAAAAYVRSLVFSPFESQEIASPLIPEGTQPPSVESTAEPPAGGEAASEGDAVSTAEVEEEETEEAPSPSGMVFGNVVNGSGSELPEDLEITLYGYDHFEEVVNLTTQLDEEGRFIFEGVNLTEEFVFFTLVDYMDTNYGSDFHIVGPEETHVDLSVTIYETTTDPSTLVLDRLHVFITYPTPDIVQVIHTLSISNVGTKTVIPPSDGEAIVEYILPEGASNLLFEQGDIGQPFIATANGFGDPSPITPGMGGYQLLYVYELPYSRKMEWVQPLTLPTNVVVLFVPESDLKVKSGQLESGGIETFNDVNYQVFMSDAMANGDELQVEISGRNPTAGSGFELSSNTTSLVVGALGLILAGFGVWWWFRSDQDGEPRAGSGETPESIIDEIIALDDAYEAGHVGEAAYQKERASLKARLLELE